MPKTKTKNRYENCRVGWLVFALAIALCATACKETVRPPSTGTPVIAEESENMENLPEGALRIKERAVLSVENQSVAGWPIIMVAEDTGGQVATMQVSIWEAKLGDDDPNKRKVQLKVGTKFKVASHEFKVTDIVRASGNSEGFAVIVPLDTNSKGD